MDIIPVIDLMQGRVVHARRGQRELYQPIQSSLCASSEVFDVVEGLLGLGEFDQLYVADLDAIQQRGHHRHLVVELLRRYPNLRIWLDAGFRHADDLRLWQKLDVTCILASESLKDTDTYLEMRKHCRSSILSLDFMTQGYQGPETLLADPALWPDKVIAMTLARVGSNAGPDYDTLRQIITRAAGRKIYAAGGIRDIRDIQLLKTLGLSGALVASALHAGNITRAQIETIKP